MAELSHSVSPSATSVSEGGSITFTVTTSNVVDNTPLYYTIDSDTNGTLYGSSSDFTSSLSGLIGNVSYNTVSKAITVATDSLYESDETFYFSVRTDSTSGTIVARSSQITITGSSISISATNTTLLIVKKHLQSTLVVLLERFTILLLAFCLEILQLELLPVTFKTILYPMHLPLEIM